MKYIFITLICLAGIGAAWASYGFRVGGNIVIPDWTNPAWGVADEPNIVYDVNWPHGIGIPTPAFGIDETYRMYDSEPNRNPALTYYASPDAGYYTHYVDSTDPNATTNGVPSGYGSPANPRTYPPLNLPAGSVVEIHNASLVNHAGSFKVTGAGDPNWPIFVRGVNNPTVPSSTVGYNNNTQYVIIEGMTFNGSCWVIGRYNQSLGGADFDTNHISIRNCTAQGDGVDSGGRISVARGSGSNENYTNNVVVYNCTCKDGGDWTAYEAGDTDHGGFMAGSNTSYVWFINSIAYHNSCNGIQLLCETENNDTDPNDPNTPNHIYVGSNIFYENMQPGFWTKTARDVIFSSNISYNHKQDTMYGTLASGAGGQYKPLRVWYIFNRMYDNHHGVKFSNLDAKAEEIYLIGNLIYDCNGIAHRGSGYPGETYAGWGDGFQFNGYPTIHQPITYCFNVVDGAGTGIRHFDNTSKVKFFNNIFTNCSHTRPGYWATHEFYEFDPNQIYIINSTVASLSEVNYNFYDESSGFTWVSKYADLAAFQAGKSMEPNGVQAADPLYTDPDNGDYTLQAGSPVLNMDISPDAQTVFDRFFALYGVDISDYAEDLFVTGTLHVPSLE